MARTGMSGSGVVAVCGNGEHFVPYEGTKFTAGRLQSWMVTFSDGTPCMRGLKITYGQDLNHLKRTELETLVVALGTVSDAWRGRSGCGTAPSYALKTSLLRPAPAFLLLTQWQRPWRRRSA